LVCEHSSGLHLYRTGLFRKTSVEYRTGRTVTQYFVLNIKQEITQVGGNCQYCLYEIYNQSKKIINISIRLYDKHLGIGVEISINEKK